MHTAQLVSVAFGDYDHTRDLWNGRVVASGIELDATPVATPEELFSRFLAGEWDAAELSLAVVAARISQGDKSFVALPVFPARAFRHSAIYVQSAGIDSPADLQGKRVGIPAWAQTAGIFARGLLSTDYNVDLTSIKWVQAGVDEPGRKEPVDINPTDYDIEAAPERTLDELLRNGEVDAVISARPPASVVNRDKSVKRLFPRFTFDEMAYSKESGIFPIMHVLVVRREVYDRNPGIAEELIRVFTEAKDRSMERALSPVVPSYPLPWASANANRARDLLGDDFWPYGIEANRSTLELFLDQCADQQVTARQITVEELFARD